MPKIGGLDELAAAPSGPDQERKDEPGRCVAAAVAVAAGVGTGGFSAFGVNALRKMRSPVARKYDFLIFQKKIDVFGARSPESDRCFLRPIGRSPQIGRAAENF